MDSLEVDAPVKVSILLLDFARSPGINVTELFSLFRWSGKNLEANSAV